MKKSLFLAFLIPMVAFGQASLKGTITDAANKEAMIGVNVILEGTSLGIATDIEGQYRIVGIPERVFHVKVSCIGYEPKVTEIDFSKTKEAQLNIQLSPTVIQGKEVVITAQMRGQLAAINQQVSSNTIVNVVSEEKIKELPDANAAEAIGRLPGVAIQRSGGEASKVVLRGMSSRFSNFSIDGVSIPGTDSTSKDVDLSLISQGSLAGVELRKTLTPDQDGDAIAGSVNLVTRKAPSEREIKLDLKGGYNHVMKSTKQYDVAGRYAERFFDDILGVQLQGNTEKKIRSKELLTVTTRAKWNPFLPGSAGEENDYDISRATTEFMDEIRTREGGQVILDVNTPDSGSVKVTGVTSSTKRELMSYNNGYTELLPYTYQTRDIRISTANASIQGKNFLLGLDVDWGVSYAHSKFDNPYDFSMTFAPGLGSTGGGKDPAKFIQGAPNNYSAAYCTVSTFRKQKNFDKEKTARLNLTKKYTISEKLSGELKIGGKYKEKDRWRVDDQLDCNEGLEALSTLNVDGSERPFRGTRFEGYFSGIYGKCVPLIELMNFPVSTRDLFGLYRVSPIIDPEALKLWWEVNKNGVGGASGHGVGPRYASNGVIKMNEYKVRETVSSAFLMNTFNIGQAITVIAGVRIEKETNDYTGKLLDGGIQNISFVYWNDPIYDTTSRYTETVWLPNLQMAIRPTDFLTVRLAAYKALARPDYNLRLPTYMKRDGPRLVIGNPNLRDTKAWNYEVNTQVHSSTIGLVSVSAFYKVLEDLYHQTDGIGLDGDQTDLSNTMPMYYFFNTIGINMRRDDPKSFFNRLIQPANVYGVFVAYNSPNPSYAWGFEFEHQLNFSFLPVSFLQPITLSYNISITRSETNIYVNQTRSDTTFVWKPHPVTGIWSWYYNENHTVNYARLVRKQSEGQPNLYGNAALGYDIGGFSVRLSFFYQGEYIEQYSATGWSDRIVDSFKKWDITFKQQFSSYVSIFLNINNLTNERERKSNVNTERGWHILRSEELYGATAEMGVKLSL